MRTFGWRSHTPPQITAMQASIISIVWVMMWRAPRSSKRSMPTCIMPLLPPSWKPTEMSSSSTIVQNFS